MRFLLAFLAISVQCFAAERLKMETLTDPEREIKALIDSASDACEKQDLEGFLNCFTKSKKSSMKKEARKLFSENKVRMKVASVEVLLVEDDQVSFRMNYIWDVDTISSMRIKSNAVAKKEDGVWKINSEKIITSFPESEIGFRFDQRPADGLPADIGRHPGACDNGRCAIRPGPVEFKPAFDDGLPADIGRHPGACDNGRCGVPRALPRIDFRPDDGLPADIGRHPGACDNGKCRK